MIVEKTVLENAGLHVYVMYKEVFAGASSTK